MTPALSVPSQETVVLLAGALVSQAADAGDDAPSMAGTAKAAISNSAAALKRTSNERSCRPIGKFRFTKYPNSVRPAIGRPLQFEAATRRPEQSSQDAVRVIDAVVTGRGHEGRNEKATRTQRPR